MEFIKDKQGMSILEKFFPNGECDEMNFVLFSTNGCHGHGCSIEQEWAEHKKQERQGIYYECSVTFLLIKPRSVQGIYGNAWFDTLEQMRFLKKLRKSAHAAIATIGF